MSIKYFEEANALYNEYSTSDLLSKEKLGNGIITTFFNIAMVSVCELLQGALLVKRKNYAHRWSEVCGCCNLPRSYQHFVRHSHPHRYFVETSPPTSFHLLSLTRDKTNVTGYALRKTLIEIHPSARWNPTGLTVAEGNGKGSGINRLEGVGVRTKTRLQLTPTKFNIEFNGQKDYHI
ncbi:unnamed protein product [Rotaria socialis]